MSDVKIERLNPFTWTPEMLEIFGESVRTGRFIRPVKLMTRAELVAMYPGIKLPEPQEAKNLNAQCSADHDGRDENGDDARQTEPGGRRADGR